MKKKILSLKWDETEGKCWYFYACLREEDSTIHSKFYFFYFVFMKDGSSDSYTSERSTYIFFIAFVYVSLETFQRPS